jgi:3-oxoacyl-[acyl-carrier protein] reductase
MDLQINNKVAMVAAASKGIGLAIAEALANEGCKVSICSTSQENLDAAIKKCPKLAHAFVCNIHQQSDLDAWHESVVEKLGDVEILVTNSAGPVHGPLDQMNRRDWYTGLDSTLLLAEHLTRKLKDGFSRKQWGRVVHISSFVAKEPTERFGISSTLRAGMMALTRLQANEFGPLGVTVNSVLPGYTKTDRLKSLIDQAALHKGLTTQQVEQEWSHEIALKRLGLPEEVADTVAFLCSHRASYITGLSLLVDGGATSGL